MSWRKGNFRLAVAGLKSAKSRSFLTMLGIVIGVVAVICVVCIGQGVKKQIAKQVQGYGSDIVTIRPGAPTKGGAAASSLFSGFSNTPTSLLTDADLTTVRSTQGVGFAVPLAIATGSAKGDHAITSPLIIATSADLPKAINQDVASGGFFDPNANNHTIVLGEHVARLLFDDSVPLGQTLTYRDQQFIVTGVFGAFNSAPFSPLASFNDAIFLPYTTAQTLNGGSLAMYQILAKASTKRTAPVVATAIDGRLINLHGGAQQDTVLTAESTANGSDGIIHLLTLLVIGVSFIAFVVGGVGVMNVMLVSVTERLHEIGIRKAIGATNRQILMQFMSEALVLSGVGGVIGVLCSLIIVGLLRLYSGLQPVLVWQAFVIAPLVAIGVGVVFGTAPALKAARKDPIEALRHE